jgi:hypothetical protein
MCIGQEDKEPHKASFSLIQFFILFLITYNSYQLKNKVIKINLKYIINS